MQEKDTEELEEELTQTRDVRTYFAANGNELVERTLAEHLALLLASKKLTRSRRTRASSRQTRSLPSCTRERCSRELLFSKITQENIAFPLRSC